MKVESIEFNGKIYNQGDNVMITRREIGNPKNPSRDYTGKIVHIDMDKTKEPIEYNIILDTNENRAISSRFIERIDMIGNEI